MSDSALLKDAIASYLTNLRAINRSPKTITSYGTVLEAFAACLAEQGVTCLEDLTRDHILIYLEAVSPQSRSTLQHRASMVRRFLTFLLQEGRLPAGPALTLPPMKQKPRRIPRLLSGG